MLCATLLRQKTVYSPPTGLKSTSTRVGFDQVQKPVISRRKKQLCFAVSSPRMGESCLIENCSPLVWGSRSANHSNYLHVFMTNLRKKIEPDPARPQYIETVPCVGYRFSVPAHEEEASLR